MAVSFQPEIACEIVSDDAAPTSADDSDGPSLDDQMSDDAMTATSLAASIGGAVGALQSAVSAVMQAAPGLSGVASSLEGALGAVAGLTQSAGTLTIPGLIASLPSGGVALVQPLAGLVSTRFAFRWLQSAAYQRFQPAKESLRLTGRPAGFGPSQSVEGRLVGPPFEQFGEVRKRTTNGPVVVRPSSLRPR